MGEEKRAPTVDPIRKAIDRGQAADKAPGVDPAAEAEAIRRADPARPSAGGDATESLRASETRGAEDMRPSEGGGAAESARAGEAMPSPEDEAAGALSDPAPAERRRSPEP